MSEEIPQLSAARLSHRRHYDPMRSHTIKTTDTMWEALTEQGKENGRSASEEARVAIENWLAYTDYGKRPERRRSYRTKKEQNDG